MSPVGEAPVDQKTRGARDKACHDQDKHADDNTRYRNRDPSKRKLLREVTPDPRDKAGPILPHYR